MADYLLGFDVGGTKCAVILGRGDRDAVAVVDRIAFPTETGRGPGSALARLEAEARALTARHGIAMAAVAALGISCGGPLDSRRGLVLSPPNLPGWDELPIVRHFAARLGRPAFLQNDANAGALAEWRWGAGRGAQHMVFLTFGTGFGAGLILNGQLYAGANDNAGEIGHVRLAPCGPWGYGKRGAVEGFCGGAGIARLGQQIVRRHRRRGEPVAFCPTPTDVRALSAQTICRAARAGDPVAAEIVAVAGRQLGRALAILIDLFNPEVVVLGSLFVRAEELFRPPAEGALAEEALPLAAAVCRIVPAALGEAISDYAALATAADGAAATRG